MSLGNHEAAASTITYTSAYIYCILQRGNKFKFQELLFHATVLTCCLKNEAIPKYHLGLGTTEQRFSIASSESHSCGNYVSGRRSTGLSSNQSMGEQHSTSSFQYCSSYLRRVASKASSAHSRVIPWKTPKPGTVPPLQRYQRRGQIGQLAYLTEFSYALAASFCTLNCTAFNDRLQDNKKKVYQCEFDSVLRLKVNEISSPENANVNIDSCIDSF